MHRTEPPNSLSTYPRLENSQIQESTYSNHSPSQSQPPPNTESNSNNEDDETLIYEDHQSLEIPEHVISELKHRNTHQKLSFKGNSLSTLPPILSTLSHLYYLNLSHNKFVEVPQSILNLQNLEILDLSHNSLSWLPDEITKLPQLKALSLISNSFDSVPVQLIRMQNLIVLEFGENPMRLEPGLMPRADEDEESWLRRVRKVYLQREEQLHKQTPSSSSENSDIHRNRSLSESSNSSLSKASKRKGFLLHRNGQENFITTLHRQANSQDSVSGSDSHYPPLPPVPQQLPNYQVPHQLPQLQNLNLNTPQTQQHAPPLQTHHRPSLQHSDSSSLSLTGQQQIQLPHDEKSSHTHRPSLSQDLIPPEMVMPRSPISRSPYDSPRSSPKPSVADIDLNLQSTSTTNNSNGNNRLSTLEEEDHDADATETDSDANTGYASFDTGKFSRKGSMATSKLFASQTASQTQAQAPLGRRESSVKSSTIPNNKIAFECVKEAMKEVCQVFSLYSHFFPTNILQLFAETQKCLSVDDNVRGLYSLCVLLSKLALPQVLGRLSSQIGRRGQRRLASLVVTVFPELQNAYHRLHQSKLAINGDGSIDAQNANVWPVDEQLHEQLKIATRKTAKVLSLMNQMISKLANSVAGGHSDPAAGLTSRVRELSHVCIRCGTSVRRVQEQLKLRGAPSNILMKPGDSKRFYDHVNFFMKSVVSILSAIKTALSEVPQLAELNIGTEVANLTRIVKEIPPLLEQSSYRILLESEDEPMELNISSISENPPVLPPLNTAIARETSSINQTPTSAFPLPTPLTASLGAAAQMLMSPSERVEETDSYM